MFLKVIFELQKFCRDLNKVSVRTVLEKVLSETDYLTNSSHVARGKGKGAAKDEDSSDEDTDEDGEIPSWAAKKDGSSGKGSANDAGKGHDSKGNTTTWSADDDSDEDSEED